MMHIEIYTPLQKLNNGIEKIFYISMKIYKKISYIVSGMEYKRDVLQMLQVYSLHSNLTSIIDDKSQLV